MPMTYDHVAIADSQVARAAAPLLQHLLDTYAGECNKVISVWRSFQPEDLAFRPHPRSSSVRQVFEHQLLSERRFFGEFLGTPEPPPAQVLPAGGTVADFAERLRDLALPRLEFLANQPEPWWLEEVAFFDVRRSRIWVFWRRLLHTCHHRTQLTVYLRLLERKVPPTYGPTADVTWQGADPTRPVDAAGRK